MRKVICRTGEVFTDYGEYLRSQHWKNVKRKYYAKYAYECVKCGWNKNLQLHHKTYERIGREKLEDLEALCRYCHMREHGLLPVKKRDKRFKWLWIAAAVFIIVSMWFYGEK